MSKSEYTCNCSTVHHDVVDEIKEKMLDSEKYTKAAEFFKVFGDVTRIKILWALDQKEMCVCDLCDVLDMSKSAISHQLGSLRDKHLVKYRKDGKSVFYSLDDNHVRAIFETGLEHIGHINKKLED